MEQILINLIAGALGGLGAGKSSPTFDLGNVGPRWVLTSPTPIPPPPEELASAEASVPWRQVRPTGRGLLLTDEHFAAQLDWARTAVRWRRVYGFPTWDDLTEHGAGEHE